MTDVPQLIGRQVCQRVRLATVRRHCCKAAIMVGAHFSVRDRRSYPTGQEGGRAWKGRCDCALLRRIRPRLRWWRSRRQCGLHRPRACSQRESGRCFGRQQLGESLPGRAGQGGVTAICVMPVGRRRQSWSKNGMIHVDLLDGVGALWATIFEDASVRPPRSRPRTQPA